MRSLLDCLKRWSCSCKQWWNLSNKFPQLGCLSLQGQAVHLFFFLWSNAGEILVTNHSSMQGVCRWRDRKAFNHLTNPYTVTIIPQNLEVRPFFKWNDFFYVLIVWLLESNIFSSPSTKTKCVHAVFGTFFCKYVGKLVRIPLFNDRQHVAVKPMCQACE